MTYIFSFDLYKIFTLIGYKTYTFAFLNDLSVFSEKEKQEKENDEEGMVKHENLGCGLVCKFSEGEFFLTFAK